MTKYANEIINNIQTNINSLDDTITHLLSE